MKASGFGSQIRLVVVLWRLWVVKFYVAFMIGFVCDEGSNKLETMTNLSVSGMSLRAKHLKTNGTKIILNVNVSAYN